jgi:hypothetical protein
LNNAGVRLAGARDVRTATLLLLGAVLFALPGTVWAGPPFVTDDPDPLPLHTGEFYSFAAGTHAVDENVVDAAPAIEVNYSFLENTFFHAVVPFSYTDPSGEPSAYGLGDVELGFKWRFVEQSRWLPDIGVFPFLELPTGDEGRGLGNGRPQALLPLWLGKEWGRWKVYGGGGYWINPGAGNRNWWITGMVIQREITDHLYLGAEVYHQTADTEDGADGTGYSIGGGITVSEPYQIIFSFGRNLQDVDANRFSYYVGLYRTF